MQNKLKTNFENRLTLNLSVLFREIIDSKYILIQLIKQYLKLKYRRTVFGYFWTFYHHIKVETLRTEAHFLYFLKFRDFGYNLVD